MVEANNRGAALTIIERNFLGLTTVELAFLSQSLYFLAILRAALRLPDLVMASEIFASSDQVYLSTFFLTLTPFTDPSLVFFDFLDDFLEAAYAGVGATMAATLPTTREPSASASTPHKAPFLRCTLSLCISKSFLLSTGHLNPKRCWSNSVAQH